MFSDLYEKCVEQGVKIDNSNADLYIPVDDITKQILEGYQYYKGVTTFTNKDGNLWYEAPFAYTPYLNTEIKGKVGVE